MMYNKANRTKLRIQAPECMSQAVEISHVIARFITQYSQNEEKADSGAGL